MDPIDLIVRAYSLAAVQHRCQRREDAAKTPYINHPIEVADTLNRVARVRDVEVLAAAVLHDTVEDTGLTIAAIRDQLGERVAGLVAECTDDTRLPRAEQRRLQVVSAPHKSAGARLIKLADKIANMAGAVLSEWTAAQKREYLDWAEQVAAGLRGVNPALDAEFDRTLNRSRSVLAQGA